MKTTISYINNKRSDIRHAIAKLTRILTMTTAIWIGTGLHSAKAANEIVNGTFENAAYSQGVLTGWSVIPTGSTPPVFQTDTKPSLFTSLDPANPTLPASSKGYALKYKGYPGAYAHASGLQGKLKTTVPAHSRVFITLEAFMDLGTYSGGTTFPKINVQRPSTIGSSGRQSLFPGPNQTMNLDFDVSLPTDFVLINLLKPNDNLNETSGSEFMIDNVQVEYQKSLAKNPGFAIGSGNVWPTPTAGVTIVEGPDRSGGSTKSLQATLSQSADRLQSGVKIEMKTPVPSGHKYAMAGFWAKSAPGTSAAAHINVQEPGNTGDIDPKQLPNHGWFYYKLMDISVSPGSTTLLFNLVDGYGSQTNTYPGTFMIDDLVITTYQHKINID